MLSTAEIAITAPKSPQMTIHISPDTQFSLEMSALSGKQQTTIGIIGGSISLKVAKLTAGQGVSVKTDTATMAVRGTSFTVTTPPSGDILVTTGEGDVLCTDDQGKDLHATPGVVVEKRPGELYRTAAVAAAELEKYRAQWGADRAADFQKKAPKLILANARLYDRLAKELAAERTELTRSTAILSKWRDENRRGRIGLRAEVARERIAIGALLARMRRTQFQLERVSFRLLRLRALHDRGIGVGTLDAGVTTAQFFARLDREKAAVDEGLALTRFLAKLYAKRSDGALP